MFLSLLRATNASFCPSFNWDSAAVWNLILQRAGSDDECVPEQPSRSSTTLVDVGDERTDGTKLLFFSTETLDGIGQSGDFLFWGLFAW